MGMNRGWRADIIKRMKATISEDIWEHRDAHWQLLDGFVPPR